MTTHRTPYATTDTVAQTMCGTKKTYPSLDAALTAAVRNAGKFGVGFRAYPCPLCAGHHLTSKPAPWSALATAS